MDIDDFFGDKDLSNDRKFVLGKNVLHVRKQDPYGFWKCSYEKGPVPQDLSGHFTSFDEAKKAIEKYLTSQNKEVKEIITN